MMIHGFPRFLLLLPPVMLAAGGCAHKEPPVEEPVSYARVIVADFQGRQVASYIAEGKIKKTREGYRFKAMERHIPRPPLSLRYPLGRPITVAGSNIVITPAPKPLWIARADGDIP